MIREMNNLQFSEDKEKLKAILSKDEYMAYTRDDGFSLGTLLRPVWRKLQSLFPDISISKGTETLLSYVLLVVILVLVALAIYWLSKQILRQGKIRTGSILPVGEKSRSYAYYWQQAAEYRDAGNRREGVRSVFLTLLFFLEDQKRIRVDPWKTNWEYAAELEGTDPAFIRVFHDSSLLFEQIWYGKEETTETVFASIYDRVALVLEKEAVKRHAKAK